MGSSGGNNQNPWGRKPTGNQQPPDMDEILKQSKDKFKRILPKGFGGGKSFS